MIVLLTSAPAKSLPRLLSNAVRKLSSVGSVGQRLVSKVNPTGRMAVTNIQ